MKRFWISWLINGDQYQPKHDPPNEAILGWWYMGYMDGQSGLCGLVEAESGVQAAVLLSREWPTATWQIEREEDVNYIVSDTISYPLSDWMRSRMGVKAPAKNNG